MGRKRFNHRITSFLIILCLLLIASLRPVSLKATVKLEGSIKGRITDSEGHPIKGAYVYLSSPAMVGIRYYLTGKNGYYHFPDLPAGTYRLAVETPGFHTAIISGIRVETGKTLDLPIKLEKAEETEEERVLLHPLPALDRENPGISYVIDREILERIPRTKDLEGLLQLIPGASPENPPRNLNISVNGTPVASTTILLHGNEINHPMNRIPASHLNPDWIEEVEIVAAGNPPANFAASGGYLKLIPGIGQNKFAGQLQFIGADGKLGENLWSQEELNEMNNPPVVKDTYHLDVALNLEGSVLPDRVWYFTSIRYNQRLKPTPFSPWRDPNNIPYPMYNWKAKDFTSLFRLTSQVTAEINASVILSFNKNNQTVDPDFISPFNPRVATLSIPGHSFFLFSGSGSYQLEKNTRINMFLFYNRERLPRRLDEKAVDHPRYLDLISGYAWGSGPFNRDQLGEVVRIGVSGTRFQSLPGGVHELVAGAEYQSNRAEDSVWKTDNLIHYYLNGNPYYFGTGISPETGNLVGKGLVGFYLASAARDGLLVRGSLHRLSFYLNDTFNLGKRLNFSLGFRFERIQAGLAAVYKGISGNSIAFYAAEAVIVPVYGINPYSAITYPSWDNMIIWHHLSPRLGLVLDIFGRGKTLLKGTFGRYQDELSIGYLMAFSPALINGAHNFYWYDENQNGKADVDDTYRPVEEDYRVHLNDYFRKRIAPKLKAPVTGEWTATLEQQLSDIFTLSFSYISRSRTRIIEDVLYDPDSDREWYRTDQVPGLWIPFETVVPGGSGYGNVPVTVYYPSAESPAFFTRLSNVSQLKQKYSGFQLVLKKKMDARWQFMASATYSRARGNAGLGAGAVLSQLANSPNSLVNLTENSCLDLDRPWIIKAMGTYHLPRDFYLSAFFQYLSGRPWARTVTVVPPASWLESHQALNIPATVYLEEPGSRRWPAFHSLDLRLERNFKLGDTTRLNVSIDVLNVLGKKYALRDLNDNGYWYPEAEGSSNGLRIFNPSYQKILALFGTRTGQLTLTLKF
ncbi:MAG: carboxypeptidase regulatory-like domain-containing protein [Candidatus Saccharicenans sp.]|nr:carboxypeptidase regulatory-like domain-containing protein [Candidatus Saccharicenans sp.]